MEKLILLAGFMLVYYFGLYLNFIRPNTDNTLPVLNQRFSALLWNTANTPARQELKTFCYYPGSNVAYFGKGNEYIIKKVTSFEECQGWYGIVVLPAT